MPTLICGLSQDWDGEADLVFTNPYGPLPRQLQSVPAIISNFPERKGRCEEWVGGELHELSRWGKGQRCVVWVKDLPIAEVDLTDLVEDEQQPGRGFFPLDLPMRLLGIYGRPGLRVLDGFMGRGTVGKACTLLGMDFVGIDKQPERVAMAREYLGC